jgi:hypothetical protein
VLPPFLGKILSKIIGDNLCILYMFLFVRHNFFLPSDDVSLAYFVALGRRIPSDYAYLGFRAKGCENL